MPDISKIIDFQKLTTLVIGYIPSLISAGILLVLFWLGNKLIQKIIMVLSLNTLKNARTLWTLRVSKAPFHILSFLWKIQTELTYWPLRRNNCNNT